MSEAGSITVRVPLTIRRRPGRKTVVTPGGKEGAPVRVRADPALVKALARAFRWQRMLDDGRYGSISELARAEKIERGYLGKMLQLTLLAPHVVEGVLAGGRSDELCWAGCRRCGPQTSGKGRFESALRQSRSFRQSKQLLESGCRSSYLQ